MNKKILHKKISIIFDSLENSSPSPHSVFPPISPAEEVDIEI